MTDAPIDSALPDPVENYNWYDRIGSVEKIALAPLETGPRCGVAYMQSQLSENSRRTVGTSLLRAARVLAPEVAWTNKTAPHAPWHLMMPEHIAHIIGSLTRAGAASTTVNLTFVHLIGVVRHAWLMGLYPEGNIRRLESLRAPSRKRRAPQVALPLLDRTRLYDACDLRTALGARNALIIALWDGMALRRGTVCALTLADFSAEYTLVKLTLKGRHEQLHPVNDQVRALILLWLTFRGDWPGALICPVGVRGLILHKSVQTNAIYRMLKDLVKTVGITSRVTPHTFRHTYATDLLRAGLDLGTVSKLVGHASMQTTLTYDQRGLDDLARAAKQRTIPVKMPSGK